MLIYEDSHFWASIVSRCLKNTVAFLSIPPVAERSNWVKVERSILKVFVRMHVSSLVDAFSSRSEDSCFCLMECRG